MREAEKEANSLTFDYARTTGGAMDARACAVSNHDVALTPQAMKESADKMRTLSERWHQVLRTAPDEAKRARVGQGENAQLYRDYLSARGNHRAVTNALLEQERHQHLAAKIHITRDELFEQESYRHEKLQVLAGLSKDSASSPPPTPTHIEQHSAH